MRVKVFPQSVPMYVKDIKKRSKVTCLAFYFSGSMATAIATAVLGSVRLQLLPHANNSPEILSFLRDGTGNAETSSFMD